MTKFKTIISKSWIFATAAVLIVGSSSVMALTLGRNVAESAPKDAVSITTTVKENTQSKSNKNETTVEYTVKDLSKNVSDQKDLIIKKLSKTSGITPEQVEEKYKTVIANMTPGRKDISAQQAAAYAVDILKKTYGVDFKGYSAEASFSRGAVPNSDSWTVIFYSPEEAQNKDSKSYVATVNSVNGAILNVDFISPDHDYTYFQNKN